MTRPDGPHVGGDADSAPDLSGVEDHLRCLVEERRRTGGYPADVNAALDAEADAAARRDPLVVWHGSLLERRERMDVALGHLADAIDVGMHRVSTASRIPAGSLVHRASGRLVNRQIESVFGQMAAALAAVNQAMQEMSTALSSAEIRPVVDGLEHRLALLEDRVAGMDLPPR